MSPVSKSLQSTLHQIKEGFNQKLPAEALEVMHQSTQSLIDSGAASKACQQGQVVPVFSLDNQRGEHVAVSDLFGRGPLVLSFFRGFW